MESDLRDSEPGDSRGSRPKPLYKRPVVWAGVALAGGLLAWLWGRKR